PTASSCASLAPPTGCAGPPSPEGREGADFWLGAFSRRGSTQGAPSHRASQSGLPPRRVALGRGDQPKAGGWGTGSVLGTAPSTSFAGPFGRSPHGLLA